MKEFFEELTHMQTLPHGVLVEGDSSHVDSIYEFYKERFSPRVIEHKLFVTTTLSADEAREIVKDMSLSSSEEKPFVYIISALSFSNEAQNILLKSFEEPPLHVYVCVVVNELKKLLPTFKSRLHYVRNNAHEETNKHTIAFMQSSLKDRLTFIEKPAKKKDEATDDEGKKESDELKKELDVLFRQMLQVIHQKLEGEKEVDAEMCKESIEVIGNARKYLYDRGSSVKMVGEYVSLMLPIF
jgi:hypothetical protein